MVIGLARSSSSGGKRGYLRSRIFAKEHDRINNGGSIDPSRLPLRYDRRLGKGPEADNYSCGLSPKRSATGFL
jgi:hypothetical protein